MDKVPAPIVHAVSLKLPPFLDEDPALWFHQVEAQFDTRNINQQLTQYNYVIASLLPETAQVMCDVVMIRPEDNPYDTLRPASSLVLPSINHKECRSYFP